MANRWNLRESEKLNILKDKIIEKIKENGILKDLNTERKNKIIRGGQDDEEQNQMIKKMFNEHPISENLRNLLKKMDQLNISMPNKSTKQKKKKSQKLNKQFNSKRFPSVFKLNLKCDDDGKKVKGIPLGGKGWIDFETDVQDDYFYRSNEKGELEIKILGYKTNTSKHPNPAPSPNNVEDIFDVDTTGPNNSSIRITFKPKDHLRVGDEIKLNARLSSPDANLEVIFYVRIDEKNKEKKEKEKVQTELSLPKIIEIDKKGNNWIKVQNEELWEEENWDENSIIKIIEDYDTNGKPVVEAIAINLGSNILKKYISKMEASSEKQVKELRKQYIIKRRCCT